MRRALFATITASLVGATSIAAAADIDVMTQNQYLGADLTPVLQAASASPFDEQAFSAAVVAALRAIAASRPAERAQALAAEIGQRKPDVVGLQESFRFACLAYPGVPTLPGRGCDDPSIKGAFTDRLQDTVDALRGSYVMVGKVTNLNVPALPFAVNGYPALLAVADRDAILVRSGWSAAPVNFGALGFCRKASDQGCNFETAPPLLSTPVGEIAIERGFLAVDVTVRGQAYRVFNTHLEQRQLGPTLPETRLLQVGQAYELLGAALGTWDGVKKVLAIGDFNSAPGDTIPVPPYPPFVGPGLPTLPPYAIFAGAGFTDTWTLRAQPGDGFTCCQDPDLANRRSALVERIDLIFALPLPSRVVDMKVLGDTMGDKTRPPGHGGLWPSDHAAVAAKLFFD